MFTKLTLCQQLLALGINQLVADGRLAELNSDGNSLATIGTEFESADTAVDLSGDILVVDVDGRGFVLVPEDECTDGAPDEGTVGLVIETQADQPGLFYRDQVLTDGSWVDEQE